ncbi:MAG: hypothetical protein G5702_10460 [Serratia symbiotica]|nr:hypothetical protein [Serratia symbiotica]
MRQGDQTPVVTGLQRGPPFFAKGLLRVIERHNLNLRKHIKRLTRKTICYPRSFQSKRKGNAVLTVKK